MGVVQVLQREPVLIFWGSGWHKAGKTVGFYRVPAGARWPAVPPICSQVVSLACRDWAAPRRVLGTFWGHFRFPPTHSCHESEVAQRCKHVAQIRRTSETTHSKGPQI